MGAHQGPQTRPWPPSLPGDLFDRLHERLCVLRDGFSPGLQGGRYLGSTAGCGLLPTAGNTGAPYQGRLRRNDRAGSVGFPGGYCQAAPLAAPKALGRRHRRSALPLSGIAHAPSVDPSARSATLLRHGGVLLGSQPSSPLPSPRPLPLPVRHRIKFTAAPVHNGPDGGLLVDAASPVS